MKKFLLFLTVAILLVGCAGARKAKFTVNQDGSVNFSDTNMSLLQPSISPDEITRAKINDSQAQINYAVAKILEKGLKNNKINANFSIGFVNQSQQDVYFWNPDFPSQKIFLPRNGGTYILGLNTLPNIIRVYSTRRKGKVYFTPLKDYANWSYRTNYDSNAYKKTFNGIQVDLRYAIASN